VAETLLESADSTFLKRSAGRVRAAGA